jgi:hypothetical protein
MHRKVLLSKLKSIMFSYINVIKAPFMTEECAATSAILTSLRTHKFKPHILGNNNCYGLNNFGSNSTIMFKNCPNGTIWQFLYYLSGESKTVCYINAQKWVIAIKVPSNDDDNIIRMQVVPPEKLDPKVSEYLIGLKLGKNPETTNEIRDMISATGFSDKDLLSVLSLTDDGTAEFRLSELY